MTVELWTLNSDLLDGSHDDVLGVFLHGHDVLYVGCRQETMTIDSQSTKLISQKMFRSFKIFSFQKNFGSHEERERLTLFLVTVDGNTQYHLEESPHVFLTLFTGWRWNGNTGEWNRDGMGIQGYGNLTDAGEVWMTEGV